MTNHGFANGKATTVHSVLQPGTAVLVDKSGVPRTRCYCGNPLTPPQSFSRPRYVGRVWPEFSQTNITNIQPVTYVINEFVIVDPVTNAIIYRPAGTQGERDRSDLRDAVITGNYTLSQTLIRCNGFEKGRMRIPGPMTSASIATGANARLHGLAADGAERTPSPETATRIERRVRITPRVTVTAPSVPRQSHLR